MTNGYGKSRLSKSLEKKSDSETPKYGFTLGPAEALSKSANYYHSFSVARHTQVSPDADLYFRTLLGFNETNFSFLVSGAGGGRYIKVISDELSAYLGGEFGLGLVRTPPKKWLAQEVESQPLFAGYLIGLRTGIELFQKSTQSIALGLGLQTVLRKDITGYAPTTGMLEITFFI